MEHHKVDIVMKPDEGYGSPTSRSLKNDEDLEMVAIKNRLAEMEKEALMLKEEMQKDVSIKIEPFKCADAKNSNPNKLAETTVRTTVTSDISFSNQAEVDTRSVYVGNVDYGTQAEELGRYFRSCGVVNRVTILCDEFTKRPKGFAYVEFLEKESVERALCMDSSEYRGRIIQVLAKRTNKPGISTTNRPVRGFGIRGRVSRGRNSGRGRFNGMSYPRSRGAYHIYTRNY